MKRFEDRDCLLFAYYHVAIVIQQQLPSSIDLKKIHNHL